MLKPQGGYPRLGMVPEVHPPYEHHWSPPLFPFSIFNRKKVANTKGLVSFLNFFLYIFHCFANIRLEFGNTKIFGIHRYFFLNLRLQSDFIIMNSLKIMAINRVLNAKSKSQLAITSNQSGNESQREWT